MVILMLADVVILKQVEGFYERINFAGVFPVDFFYLALFLL